MTPIDIILPWVNVSDETWKNEFIRFRETETGDKQDGRFRDCNTLKYVLRSIEENCPWCRYIFLVLAGPSQIPAWLNTSNPRLKLIYHKDFIPSNFLPTYNSLLIEMFYPMIDELSEHFILINDDMLFTTKKDAEFYFKSDLPVYNIKERICYNDDFSAWMINSKNLLTHISKVKCGIYDTFHMPVQYKKSVCLFILEKIKDALKDIFKDSRFRQRYNIIHFIYYYAHIILKKYTASNESRGKFYFFNNTKQRYDFNHAAVCLNESGEIDDTDILSLTKQLEEQFPKKSSFEL